MILMKIWSKEIKFLIRMILFLYSNKIIILFLEWKINKDVELYINLKDNKRQVKWWN